MLGNNRIQRDKWAARTHRNCKLRALHAQHRRHADNVAGERRSVAPRVHLSPVARVTLKQREAADLQARGRACLAGRQSPVGNHNPAVDSPARRRGV